jgi:N-acetylglucosaminyl-diphospho-decaprenol L-rhamnosyltransferase
MPTSEQGEYGRLIELVPRQATVVDAVGREVPAVPPAAAAVRRRSGGCRTTEDGALAVVVSYGATRQLKTLLADLASIPGCDVVLVENKPGVDHGPLPAEVTLLAGHGNVGYGTAVNLAVERVRELRGLPEWLLVVNSDVTLPTNTRLALPVLFREFRDAEAIAFAMHDTNDRSTRSLGALPSVRATALTTIRGERAAVRRWPKDVYPVGAFFAIRCDTFDAVGGFDPTYWMYFEETDLFARLHAAGARTRWTRWPVQHAGAATTAGAALMQLELGRASAIYARAHREQLGRSWPVLYGIQHVALIGRRIVSGRWNEAARAVRILRGLVLGIRHPGWEPAVVAPYRAVPRRVRAEMVGRRAALGALADR